MKAKDGSELVTRTNQDFLEMLTIASKVGDLLGKIAAVSNEQRQGIEQINKAVAEMDEVVQQNAPNAEESAAASEEMNALAEQMKGNAEELVTLVGGAHLDPTECRTHRDPPSAAGHGRTMPTHRCEPGLHRKGSCDQFTSGSWMDRKDVRQADVHTLCTATD
jgi:hypothetical protein